MNKHRKNYRRKKRYTDEGGKTNIYNTEDNTKVEDDTYYII